MQKKKAYQDLTLSEAKKDSIVLAWGRFNPPTTGHLKLINAVVSEARKRGADYRIYPTKSEDPKKNPLTFKEKVRFMRKMFPRHAKKISSDERVNTLIKAAQKLEKEGYKNLTLLAGSDRIGEFKTLLNNYNKKDYTFDKIDVVSAGDRDPDAEDVSGMSASKMRVAASKGDFTSFSKGVPNKKLAKPLYNAVRKGMKVNEQFEKDGIFEYVDMIQPLNEDDGYGVIGSRFNRLLRFGLAVGGTGDIPLTRRAFKDFDKAETNPQLRQKVFATVNRVFDYLLTDDLLYNRFLLLLHRKYIFGEGNASMNFHEFKSNLIEADGTAPLSTAPDHPEKMNFVARFPAPEYTKSFINDIGHTNLVDITWTSGDGTEVQFYVLKSTAGQEIPASSDDALLRQVDRQNRYSGQDTPQFGSEARVVDLVMKHGGKISRFDGDVREGLEDESHDNGTDELLEGLLNKSWKTEVAYDLLSEVYLRGLSSWEDECTKKDTTTPDQWAYARVNSFVAGGRAQKKNDADLWEEHLRREDEPLSEMDEEFLDELGKVGKIAVAGVAYALWRKRQNKKKKEKEKAEVETEPEPEKKKAPGDWRSHVDWEKNEEYNQSDRDSLRAVRKQLNSLLRVRNPGTGKKRAELFKKKDALEKKLSGSGQSNIAWKSHGEEYDINEEFEAEAYDLDERFEMLMVDVEYIDETISPKQIHGSGRTIPKGSMVKFVHNGKIVSGMVVSFNRNVMQNVPFYVVSVKGESKPVKVPLRKLREEVEMYEEHGAGLEGTNKLRKKYTKDTPGQNENKDEKDPPTRPKPTEAEVAKSFKKIRDVSQEVKDGLAKKRKLTISKLPPSYWIPRQFPPGTITRSAGNRKPKKITDIANRKKTKIDEESPPSDKAERFIKKNKESFKDKYGDRHKEVLYATAWKMHNKHWKTKEK